MTNGIGMFVDGAALRVAWESVVGKNVQIDIAKLMNCVARRHDDVITEAYWYDATPNGRPGSFHRALGQNGFRTKIYALEVEEMRHPVTNAALLDADGTPLTRRRQKHVDVDLAVGIVSSHLRTGWKNLVFAGGDADFSGPIQDLVEKSGVSLTIIGAREGVSHTLFPYASRFLDLRDIRRDIQRGSLAVAS